MKGLAIDRPQDNVLGIIRHIVSNRGLQDNSGNKQHTYGQFRLELIRNKLRETINDNLLELLVSDNEYDDYLDRLRKEIEGSLKRLIDRQIEEWDFPQTEENVSLKIDKHRQFSLEQIGNFSQAVTMSWNRFINIFTMNLLARCLSLLIRGLESAALLANLRLPV